MLEHGETSAARKDPVIDPKAVVLHLRVIHFSLLVACVGPYILVTAGGLEEINPGRSQLAEIVAVIERWQPGWVENAARGKRNQSTTLEMPSNHAAGPIRLSIGQPWTLLPLQQGVLDLANPGAQIGPLDPNGPLWSALAEPKRRDMQLLPVPRTEFVSDVFPLNLPAPQTLKDFESYWNALGRIKLTLTEASWIFPDTMGPKSGELGTLPFAQTQGANGITVFMRLEPIADAQQEVLR
ncbi:hypothetical protein [Ruegeria hyattellae]|uniref:hypothetical protein n=1 Tax=Ruegeria hyattellae TaxID=3233337 RepID=UPI00355B4B2D